MTKHMIMAAALLIAGAATAQDRQQRSPEEMAKARTERLTTVLELSPEQAAKVEAMHLQQAKEAQAQRAEHEAKREAKRAAMEQKRAQHEAEMKAILTPEQFVKWQALRDQRKEGMEKRKESMKRQQQGGRR